MLVQSLGWEDPLEEEMATQSSILAWRIPWTEETGGLWSIGNKKIKCSIAACGLWPLPRAGLGVPALGSTARL